jgi:hypothetical protein
MKLRLESLLPIPLFIADPVSIFASAKIERPLKMCLYRWRLARASDCGFLF